MTELVLEKEKLLEFLANDTQLPQEVIGIFLADCPGKLAMLRAAVRARDFKQIANDSHSLRGSVSIFGAKSTVEATQKLESMGRKGIVEDVDEVFSVVEYEIALVTSALEQIAKDDF